MNKVKVVTIVVAVCIVIIACVCTFIKITDSYEAEIARMNQRYTERVEELEETCSDYAERIVELEDAIYSIMNDEEFEVIIRHDDGIHMYRAEGTGFSRRVTHMTTTY